MIHQWRWWFSLIDSFAIFKHYIYRARMCVLYIRFPFVDRKVSQITLILIGSFSLLSLSRSRSAFQCRRLISKYTNWFSIHKHKQSSIEAEARRTPIHNNNKTEFVLIYLRNRGWVLYSIGCVLCVHWIITSPSLIRTPSVHTCIGREKVPCVRVCVCSSTNSKHFLFHADYGRLLLIGLVDDGFVRILLLLLFISFHLFLCSQFLSSLFIAVRIFCPHF